MALVIEFLANGFEEVEALAPVDILRRGGVEVITVSTNSTREVTSSHGVTILADTSWDDLTRLGEADMLLLPGGMPGSTNLRDNDKVIAALQEHYKAGKKVGAICAAPLVLAHAGLLEGRQATIYPGMDSYLKGAQYKEALYVEDGNIITGEGPAAVLPYAYRILSYFVGEEKTDEVASGMIYDRLLKEAK